MKHPAHYFIVYLFLMGPDPTIGGVQRQLHRTGLALPPEEVLSAFQQTLPALPSDLEVLPMNKGTYAFLRSQRILSLVTPDEITEKVDLLMTDTALRHRVETLLLGRVSPREVVRLIGKEPATLPVVQEFQHYFWNTTRMTVQDWEVYFSWDASKDSPQRSLPYKHPLRSALLGGESLACYHAGLEQKLDGQKLLEKVLWANASLLADVEQLPPGPEKALMLGTVTRSITRALQLRNESDAAIQDTIKMFEKFQVRLPGGRITTLADLAPTGSISRSRGKEEKKG